MLSLHQRFVTFPCPVQRLLTSDAELSFSFATIARVHSANSNFNCSGFFRVNARASHLWHPASIVDRPTSRRKQELCRKPERKVAALLSAALFAGPQSRRAGVECAVETYERGSNDLTIIWKLLLGPSLCRAENTGWPNDWFHCHQEAKAVRTLASRQDRRVCNKLSFAECGIRYLFSQTSPK
jgi:hypothetical protein